MKDLSVKENIEQVDELIKSAEKEWSDEVFALYYNENSR